MGKLGRVGFWVLIAVLLLPAAALTLARLVEPPISLVLQYEAFLPFALPLYLAALLLLLAGGARAWRRRRTLRTPSTLLAVLAALGLAVHGWWFAPLVVGETPAPADGGKATNVMSTNLLGGRGDARAVVDAVRERDVDVLVLVETTTRSADWLEQEGLTDLLPHHAGQAGPPWSVTGTMVFAREPVDLVETVRTHADSLVVTVGDLSLLAVHPVPPIMARTWLDEHEMLLDATVEHRPDLVVGDFNATLDHAPMREYDDLGYRDAVELTNGGFRPTWPTLKGPGLLGFAGIIGPVAQIDHVMVDDGWTVLDVSTHDLHGSDHRYVVARVAATG